MLGQRANNQSTTAKYDKYPLENSQNDKLDLLVSTNIITKQIIPTRIKKDNCQTPHPNEDPKDQFGFGVTLKSKDPPTTTHPPTTANFL